MLPSAALRRRSVGCRLSPRCHGRWPFSSRIKLGEVAAEQHACRQAVTTVLGYDAAAANLVLEHILERDGLRPRAPEQFVEAQAGVHRPGLRLPWTARDSVPDCKSCSCWRSASTREIWLGSRISPPSLVRAWTIRS